MVNRDLYSSPYGSHVHSSGFSHQRKTNHKQPRSTVRPPRYSIEHEQYLADSWEELVDSTPQKDANVEEVRTWMLKVFHRRCHPDPARALQEFRWTGRDLHYQRRYLALRIRFRGEPYAYMIAHDVHDAVKESRKRTRKRKQQAKKQSRRPHKPETKSTTASALTPQERSFRASFTGAFGDAAIGQAKAKTKKTRKARRSTISAAECLEQDPFRDPEPTHAKLKAKTKKLKKSKGEAKAGSVGNPQDPFRDPEPMRFIDTDDYRIESPLASNRPWWDISPLN
ncbi:hypothetical protein F5Y19DRAFT_490510 [Xylariaceae sp. FL1651]|nr:hypothetical protein F5Y19DRAFT_490510 [Xylariaceae sp. FL1651]